jgi:RimJ/RimL family protein N-acetyltransferase
VEINPKLRDAKWEDLAALAAVEAHPWVAVWQYPTTTELQQDFLHQILSGTAFPGCKVHLTVIERDGRLIGFIQHTHRQTAGVEWVVCGWSLLPEYWGQGIMSNALRQLFDRFFASQIEYVFADYFHGNHRCQRLLEKLGFVPQPIPWLERLRIIWGTRHLVWLHRTRLDRPSGPEFHSDDNLT